MWLHTLIYSAVMASTVFVIVELEYPRMGVIQVADADELLRELRASMNEDYRSSR